MAKKKAPSSSKKQSNSTTISSRSTISDDEKLFALLGAAIPLIGYVIAVLAKKNGPYATFYGKQGVVLFIAALAASILNRILDLIPVIGPILSTLIAALIIVLWVLGIINALSTKARDTPLIGVYAGKL